MSKALYPQTSVIHDGKEQTQYREHNRALFLTSSFVFESARQSAALFTKEIKGFTYTRTVNSTIAAFGQRISTLEGAECSVVTSAGVSTIQTLFFTFLKAGDHVISNRSLLGTTAGFINNIVTKSDIEVSYVSRTDLSGWWTAVEENTKLLFLETPSNSLNEMAGLETLSEIAHAAGVLLVVGNSSLSSIGQQPSKYGVDISIQSTTKAVDGHGRMMGGMLSDSEELMTQVAMYCNSCGLAMSSLSVWVLLNSAETLSIRMERQFAGALEVARWPSEQPQVKVIHYSDLPGHPRAALVAKQQLGGGIVVGFEINSKGAAWSLFDKVELLSETVNLGDVCSIITHPWIAIHGRMSSEDKQAVGIRPGLLRLTIDLEYPDDLIADLQQAVT